VTSVAREVLRAVNDLLRARPGRASGILPSVAMAEPFRGSVLEAVLERITFANEETGYTVAKVDTGRGPGDLVTVVGALLGAQPGESLRMRGRWGSHPQYGKQFHVDDYTTVLPATIQGIRRYLGSGLVKGIGPRLAERIVEHFGVDALDVIENEPARLIEVPKLGPKRTKLIADAWEEQKAIKDVMVFLQGVDLQAVRGQVHRRGAPRALPARHRRVGHRVPHGGRHRQSGRHPSRQSATRQGGLAVHAVRGHR
jgi:hypothetical protein